MNPIRTIWKIPTYRYNIHTHMNPVGKKRVIEVKLHILSYSTGGSGMVSGLFSSKNFVKILISRFTRSISRFLITTHFPGNFPKISRKFLENFSEIYCMSTYPPHLPLHIIHSHPPPTSLDPLRTSNLIFSKSHFSSNGTFFSHTFHVWFINKYDYILLWLLW